MGRTKLLSVQDIEKAFEEYKQWVKENPILVEDYVGKDAHRVHREKNRPLSIDAFQIYCQKHYSCVDHYFDNDQGDYSDYSEIVARIRKETRVEQIEGAVSGVYNSSIVARLNNLEDTNKLVIQAEANRIASFFPDESELNGKEDKS